MAIRATGGGNNPDAPLLAVRDLTVLRGSTLALDSAQLTVSRPGAVHALLGQSGCGKSTMLGVLAGQLRPAGGSITLAGREHAFTSTVDSRAAGVSMVSQELSLAPHLSVAENVLMGRALPLDDDAGESPRPRRRRRRGREWAGAWEGRRSRLRG